MHTFLKSIADGYLREGCLDRYVFVFPNSRSARYFAEYLQGGRVLCVTMGEVMEKASGYKRASRNTQLVMLYRAYTEVLGKYRPEQTAESFDRFRYWAEMLVRDFDEVDQYMVEPRELFRNVKDYKEIQSYYLTPEQERIIRRYWGEDPYWGHLCGDKPGDDDDKPLWVHLQNADKKKSVGRFLQLWEILLPLYTRFRELLEAEGIAYQGMAAKKSAQRAMAGIGLSLAEETYVFIGFNRLTTAQHIVMERMRELGKAHFYWDYDPALMDAGMGNKAGRFISEYVRDFDTSHPFVTIPAFEGVHEVDIYGISSAVGQVKAAATLLTNEDMAVVLPSEELLLPMVASVPGRFEEINVTMGYPLRMSVAAQLFSLFMQLQLNARETPSRGVEYFRNDIKALLSHPALRKALPDEIKRLDEIHCGQRTFNLAYDAVARADGIDTLRPLLTPVADLGDIDSVSDYCQAFFAMLLEAGLVKGIDRGVVQALSEQTDELRRLSKRHGVAIGDRTAFNMLQRSLFTRSMALIGQSFNALQIMSMLETRALGFDDVMILSMNDDVFPGRSYSRSFIPDSLRRAYGLMTAEHTECDRAYYIYRILSHARRLTMIYDSTTGELNTGEPSRFIEQLCNLPLPGVRVHRHSASYGVMTAAGAGEVKIPEDIRIDKRAPHVKRVLERFLDPALKDRYYLSASALKNYKHCKLKFYMERVANMRVEEEKHENMDALAVGNIFHECMERIYGKLPTPYITRGILDELMSGGFDNLLHRELQRSINVNYCNVPATDGDGNENLETYTRPISQEASLYYHNILDMVMGTLSCEPDEFKFEQAEAAYTFPWKIFADRSKSLNLMLKIDRIDTVNGIIRLIDYKTGSDETTAQSMDTVMGDNKNKNGYFQLMVYCLAFLDLFPDVSADKIQPMIYLMNDMFRENRFKELTYNRKPVKTFKTLADDALAHIRGMIEEIFDYDVPFTRPDKCALCAKCDYNRLCFAKSPGE